MIHVSDLLHLKKCEAYCWNAVHHRQVFEGFYHMDRPFSKLWKEYLGLENTPSGQVGDSNERSLELLEQYGVVTNLRFEYKECRTRIPILEKVERGYRAIYPFLSAYPKENEALVMKINQEIVGHCGIDIVEHKIVYINRDYVRDDVFDLRACLATSRQLFNRKNRLNKTIEECMEAQDFDLDAWIEQTKEVLEKKEIQPILSKTCTSNRRCTYYNRCFDEAKLEDNSILFLTTSQHKVDAYHHGMKYIHQLPIDDLDGFRLQYSQFRASKEGRFVDRMALESWLDYIKGPVSYLDFEWDTFAIPPYKGMRPFDVLCFQYSLHIEKKKLVHKDFFGTGDCRRAFIESLIKSVPKQGSILVYNMEGAEKLRLVQLAQQFPEYKEDLEQIWSRMVDLSKPFEAGVVYDNAMRGHYSLKSVLPVFTDRYSYSHLDINDGLMAVHAYRTIDKVSLEERKEISEQIRTYCGMDTFAEYIVYHGLKEIVEKEGQDA